MKTIQILVKVKVPNGLEEEYERDLMRAVKDGATRLVHGLGHGISWGTAKTYVSAKLIKA